MSQSGSIVFISSRAPWSSSAPLACLEALMTTAVFDVPTQLVLIAEGVFQLLKGQDGNAAGSRDVTRMFGALGLYGVTEIYVDSAALLHYGLTLTDLLAEQDCEVPLQLYVSSASDLQRLIAGSKVVFNF